MAVECHALLPLYHDFYAIWHCGCLKSPCTSETILNSPTAWEVLESSIKRMYGKPSVCTFFHRDSQDPYKVITTRTNEDPTYSAAQNGNEIGFPHLPTFSSWGSFLSDSSVSSQLPLPPLGPHWKCTWPQFPNHDAWWKQYSNNI